MTKEELKKYKVYKLEIQSISDSILELQATLENVAAKPITDDPMNHNAFLVDKQSELVLKKIDLEEKLISKRQELIKAHEDIEDAIEQLNSPIERTILRMRYIEGLKWEEICVRIDYGWDNTHTLHRMALKNISKIN